MDGCAGGSLAAALMAFIGYGVGYLLFYAVVEVVRHFWRK